MLFLKYVLMALILLFASTANAHVVLETWEGKVGLLTNTTAYTLGQKITWTVSYSTVPSRYMSIFNDGTNGTSDRGQEDDTLETLFCLDPTLDASCDTTLTTDEGFFMLVDSVTSIGDIRRNLVEALEQGESPYDYWPTNRDNRTSRTVPWGILEQLDYWADDFWLAADDYPYRCAGNCPNTGNAIISLAYLDRQGALQFSQVTLTNVTRNAAISAVAIPSTATLLGIGLIAVRFKRGR